MRRLVDTMKEREASEKLPVVEMEIDYELMNLHEALQQGDDEQINLAKSRLKKLRREWIHLRA
ncbi:hypothetical protein N781_12990 [Pontibacillus halophilus JSM 076056 = DSM 19796]|uniref:Uncharacterized protein n=1 Tax=Pontibacillus halophilus JSM 076056 = DSM 19796 TaxID=1385510 RepID=A0A0A5GQ62_9BACI|nr:hypothetical protein [Pontibacillus halophilus]KGX93315.1 hypothetical protein N781_12990 [Pontibacillus halophilus JSM 076056 = DSM 19796]